MTQVGVKLKPTTKQKTLQVINAIAFIMYQKCFNFIYAVEELIDIGLLFLPFYVN